MLFTLCQLDKVYFYPHLIPLKDGGIDGVVERPHEPHIVRVGRDVAQQLHRLPLHRRYRQGGATAHGGVWGDRVTYIYVGTQGHLGRHGLSLGN